MTQRILRIGTNECSDVSTWFMGKVNYVLDRLYFEVRY